MERKDAMKTVTMVLERGRDAYSFAAAAASAAQYNFTALTPVSGNNYSGAFVSPMSAAR